MSCFAQDDGAMKQHVPPLMIAVCGPLSSTTTRAICKVVGPMGRIAMPDLVHADLRLHGVSRSTSVVAASTAVLE
jgi:hypothetical protein